MYILGLTTLGDAAASLVCDGKLVAAAEEERFSRVKHHSGFPYNALQFCLNQAGIGIGDVEHVSLYWKPWILGRKAAQALKSLAISMDMFRARVDRGVAQVSDSYLGMLKYPRMIRRRYGPSGFLVSPFESAAIFTLDGTGEETTTLFSRGQGTRIQPLKRIKLPHSLGQFYSAVTISASTFARSTITWPSAINSATRSSAPWARPVARTSR